MIAAWETVDDPFAGLVLFTMALFGWITLRHCAA
jgi:hypothetical protein